MHPACVHSADSPVNRPAAGWVTISSRPSTTSAPPTGTSAAAATRVPADPTADGGGPGGCGTAVSSPVGGAADGAATGVAVQAATAADATAAPPTSTLRRVGEEGIAVLRGGGGATSSLPGGPPGPRSRPRTRQGRRRAGTEDDQVLA